MKCSMKIGRIGIHCLIILPVFFIMFGCGGGGGDGSGSSSSGGGGSTSYSIAYDDESSHSSAWYGDSTGLDANVFGINDCDAPFSETVVFFIDGKYETEGRNYESASARGLYCGSSGTYSVSGNMLVMTTSTGKTATFTLQWEKRDVIYLTDKNNRTHRYWRWYT